MRVRIDIGLDFEGFHTFRWQPSNAPGSVEIPYTTLQRWTREHEAFGRAHQRWKHVVEELEEHLYAAESTPPGLSSSPKTVLAHAQTSSHKRR